jgi:hypothetical protein
MTLPDIDSNGTLGGSLQNYSPVIDPTTDRDAAGANVAYADTAAMTATAVRAWVQIKLNGTSTPTVVSHNSVWGNSLSVIPTLVRTGVGVVTITWPATVADAIPNGLPGYNAAGHTLNLRACLAPSVHVSGALTPTQAFAEPTSANVVTIHTFVSGLAADSSQYVDVFAI